MDETDPVIALRLEVLATRDLALRREVEIERLRATEARLVARAMEAERLIAAQRGLLADRERLIEARGDLLAEREKVIEGLEGQLRAERAEKERLLVEMAGWRQGSAPDESPDEQERAAGTGRLRRHS